MKKKAFIGFIVILVLIQFIPKREMLPPVDESQDFFSVVNAPEEVETLVKDACYQCHSHSQEFPWYDAVQPISWWIRGHVYYGQSSLDFATWSQQDASEQSHKMLEASEEVASAHMPMKSYTWMHEEAQLDERERKLLAAFFKSMGSD